MRYGYVLWAVVVTVGWAVLAVLSEDPWMRWGYAAVATMFAVGTFFARRERRRQEDRRSPDAGQGGGG